MFQRIINTWINHEVRKKRMKEFRLISKMDSDNVADAMAKYFPTTVTSWQIEAVDRLSSLMVDLLRVKMAQHMEDVKIEGKTEHDGYYTAVHFSGLQINKMFEKAPPKEVISAAWERAKELTRPQWSKMAPLGEIR